MALAVVYSRAADGIDSPLVAVEVHVANGLPSLSVVGLPEAAVKESKDRVRAALLNGHFEFPAQRITVNLAPADLPKEGARYDLAIALGILAASGQLPPEALRRHEFVGELALGGEIRPVKGVLPSALCVREADRAFVVPRENAEEAALVAGVLVLPVGHLLEVCAYLRGEQKIAPHVSSAKLAGVEPGPDLHEVQGQFQARRVLEIAAAGRHSLLFTGPPGTGKTMLASRLPGILPAMDEQEAIEAAAVQSISDSGFDFRQWKRRIFRAPHHTASAVALVGGGSHPKPGEISLAHHGVLFLDELPEFDRKVLEVLREPLESGHITISRAARQVSFPARFQLVAAMNPCPCGFLGDHSGRCRCTPEQIARYRGKISGPLLDRIDMQIEVQRPANNQLFEATAPAEGSAAVRARVEAAHRRQMTRAGKANAHLLGSEIERDCALDESDRHLLRAAMERLRLSMRAYHRILKVARTIADLAGESQIQTKHLTEALSYRERRG